MARMFVALDLPDPVRAALARLQTGIHAARWAPPAQLHLTLRFIGDVAEEALPALRSALTRTMIGAPFEATLTGAGTFGRPPRVLYVGMAPAERLCALAEQADAAVAATGGPPPDKPFHPHVTVARLKNASPAQVRAFLDAQAVLRFEPFKVTAVHLYRSTLSSQGARHDVDTELQLVAPG